MAASDWNPLRNADWSSLFEQESQKEYWACLRKCIEQERSCFPDRVFPHKDRELEALRLTQCSETRVVIVGQDPYHGPGLADGLAFSVPQDAKKLPPSLRNILRALREDPALPRNVRSVELVPTSLAPWAQRGVLLLNMTLTVRQEVPGSHLGLGWETFTERVIQELQEKAKPVFALWGEKVQKAVRVKLLLGGTPRAMIVESQHPRMPSFPESRPFSRLNEALGTEFDWSLRD